MPVSKNQIRANNFRNEERPKQSYRPRQEEEKPDLLPRIKVNTQSVRTIAGLFSVAFSLAMAVSFVSYLFTWQQDQSYVSPVNGGWSNLFKTAEELVKSGVQDPIVDNWLGKFGALLSNQFMFEWFGIASFVLIPVFFILGFRAIFKVTIVPVSRLLGYSFFLLLYCSLAFGFLHSFWTEVPHFMEGQFGFWTHRWLFLLIGETGVGVLLLFVGLSVAVFAFDLEFKLPERKPRTRKVILNDIDDDELISEEAASHMEFQVNHASTLNRRYSEEAHRPLSPIPTFNSSSASNPVQATLVEEVNVAPLPVNTLHQTIVSVSPDSQADLSSSEDNLSEEPEHIEMVAGTEPEVSEVETLSDMPNRVQEVDFSVTPRVLESNDDEDLQDEDTDPDFVVADVPPEQTSEDLVQQFGQYDPKLDLSSYVYPHTDLLDNHKTNKIPVSADELEANKNKIVATLNNYNIEIDKIMATIGPTVTLYEIIPAPGVRISKIKNLEDDIALSLAALGIRIIAPMPGKGTIGIEVPNQQPEMVPMRAVMATEKFRNSNMDLPIALGKTISNEVFIADLAKMPHLLVAGATGQGKSVGINAILVSLLYKLHPSQLKFVLVDPKKVELSLFKKIERHFLAKLPGEEEAIITDTKKVINTLNSLCIEMDQRYDLLKDAQVRNLKEYNHKFINRKLNPENGHRYLPFIVLIVDEFADLMMTAGKEVETPIARLAQLARAVGIHLVIATQRPSVNIITGTIKANFPARLAFRVLSKIDSRTILDTGGADQLIGRGDMLLALGSDLIRLQCAFVDTPEVDRVSDFIGAQRGYSSAWLLPEYVDENGEGGSVKDFDLNDRDPLFEDAAKLIVLHQQGSTSLIQRKLKLGYNRAGRIIDQLEAAGVVGPFEGSKAREVLIPDEYALMQFLDNLGK